MAIPKHIAPISVMILNGCTENDVMPSTAKDSILLVEYFDFPANRSLQSKYTLVSLNPKSLTIPRRNKFLSGNSNKACKAFFPNNLKSA